MKYFLALALSVFTSQLFAQHQQPQMVQDPQSKKQFPVAQQNPQAPQISVTHYDTVLVQDPLHPNEKEMKIYSSTGRLVKTGRILNGKKEGIWRSYYEN